MALHDRLFNELRVTCTGVTDTLLAHTLWDTINDLCRDALVWRKTLEVPLVANQTEYPITVPGAEVAYALSVAHPTLNANDIIYDDGMLVLSGLAPSANDVAAGPLYFTTALAPALPSGTDVGDTNPIPTDIDDWLPVSLWPLLHQPLACWHEGTPHGTAGKALGQCPAGGLLASILSFAEGDREASGLCRQPDRGAALALSDLLPSESSQMRSTSDVPPGATRYPLKVADVVVVGTGSGGGSGSGLSAEEVDDRVAALLQPGTNVTLSYNDAANTLTINATGGGGGSGLSAEEVDDRIAALLQAGTNVTLAYNDAANTLTISAAGGTGTVVTGGGIVFEARASVPAATIDPAIKVFQTQGFSVAGDTGNGSYKRRSGAPTDVANKAYVQSADGAWWELLPEGGEVRIEQFGAKADFNGTTGTDLYQPLLDARKFTAWFFNPTASLTYKIRLSAGKYYCSKTNYMYELSNIEGVGSYIDGSVGGATQIWFPHTPISWFVYHGGNTGPGGDGLGEGGAVGGLGTSAGSRLANVALHGPRSPTWPTDLTKRAIYGRTQVHLENVQIVSAPGEGVFLQGSIGYGGDLEGNANDFSIRNLLVHSSRGDALHFQGMDANGGYVQGFKSHTEVGGCGLRAENVLTNYIGGMQITGYGQSGAHRSGKRYMLISNVPGIGQATVPGTNNNIWYFQEDGGPTAVWPEWSASNSYRLGLPIWDVGSGNYYNAPYVEVFGVLAHVLPPARIEGGTIAVTSMSNRTGSPSPGIFSNLGYGAIQEFQPVSAEHTQNGPVTWVRMGGSHEEFFYGAGGGLTLLAFRRLSDLDVSWRWGFSGNDIDFTSPHGTIWSMTTNSTTVNFGRSAVAKGKLVLRDFAIQDPNDSGNRRIMGIRANRAQLPTDAATGEFYHETYAAPWGAAAWICTVGHATAPTWHSVPVFGVTSVTPQYNGHLVVECTSNTSLTFKYKGSDGVIRSATLALA